MADDLNLFDALSPEKQAILNFRMQCISPDEGKYGSDADPLRPYLSADAEWRGCAHVQEVLVETRAEFGQASNQQVEEVKKALLQINPANIGLLERKLGHDQLALLEEIGRFVSLETKAKLHPGTTSFDILDTARSYLFRGAWNEVILPQAKKAVSQTLDLSERTQGILQTGRTHLQNTSPVLLSGVFAAYASRIAERIERCNEAFGRLRGKISGIVGTGAGVDMVIGLGKSIEFEEKVLAKLGLKPDYTATQIVQKESLADVGNQINTLALVIGDLSNDVRILYSSAIKEMVSFDTSKRLGGSSADAAKDNPISWENIVGKLPVITGGQGVLYALVLSDLQRDLRGSVQARYQPQLMITEAYESLVRLNKALPQLSPLKDNISKNLVPVRENPSEAMVAILRGEGWTHSRYGVGHEFVKHMSRIVKQSGRKLLEVCLDDSEFKQLYIMLEPVKREVLEGKFENYMQSAYHRQEINTINARQVLSRI